MPFYVLNMQQALPRRAALPHGHDRPALFQRWHPPVGGRDPAADGGRRHLFPEPRESRLRSGDLRLGRGGIRVLDVGADGASVPVRGGPREPSEEELEGDEDRALVRLPHVYQVSGAIILADPVGLHARIYSTKYKC